MRFALAVSIALVACDDPSPAVPVDAIADAVPRDAVVSPDAPEPDAPASVAALIRARPYTARIPAAYTAERPWPLLLLVHGYGAAGLAQAAYLGLTASVDRRGVLLAVPDGTLDRTGRRFWNATDACCDDERTGVDDVAYLTAVVDDMAARYRVDPARVFVLGHSNGGFMAHRLACDRADRFAAAVSIAGATWADPDRCTPTRTIAMLLMHGTADDTVRWDGDLIGGDRGAYPSARASTAAWARLNRCDEAFTDDPARGDYDSSVSGAETRIGRHEHCAAGGAAELWAMEGSGHVPVFTEAWNDALFAWLEAHARRDADPVVRDR